MISLNDKHLEAYISTKITELEGSNKNVKVTTLVKFHNTLGRLYFFMVYPFHCIIVGMMIKHAIGKLIQPSPCKA
jgi:hypothetical protein